MVGRWGVTDGFPPRQTEMSPGVYRVDNGSGTAHFCAVYPTPARHDMLQGLVLDCFDYPRFTCLGGDEDADGVPDIHYHGSPPSHVLLPM